MSWVVVMAHEVVVVRDDVEYIQTGTHVKRDINLFPVQPPTGNGRSSTTRTTQQAHPTQNPAATPPIITPPRPDQDTTPAPLVQALERTSVSPGALEGMWGGPAGRPEGDPVGSSVSALSQQLQQATVYGGGGGYGGGGYGGGGVYGSSAVPGEGGGVRQLQRSVSSAAVLGGGMYNTSGTCAWQGWYLCIVGVYGFCIVAHNYLCTCLPACTVLTQHAHTYNIMHTQVFSTHPPNPHCAPPPPPPPPKPMHPPALAHPAPHHPSTTSPHPPQQQHPCPSPSPGRRSPVVCVCGCGD